MPSDEENIMKLLKRRCLIPFNNVNMRGCDLKAICDRLDIPYDYIGDDTICTFKNGTLSFQVQAKEDTDESD